MAERQDSGTSRGRASWWKFHNKMVTLPETFYQDFMCCSRGVQGQRIKEEEQEHIHRLTGLKLIWNLKHSTKSVKLQLKTGENHNYVIVCEQSRKVKVTFSLPEFSSFEHTFHCFTHHTEWLKHQQINTCFATPCHSAHVGCRASAAVRRPYSCQCSTVLSLSPDMSSTIGWPVLSYHQTQAVVSGTPQQRGSTFNQWEATPLARQPHRHSFTSA